MSSEGTPGSDPAVDDTPAEVVEAKRVLWRRVARRTRSQTIALVLVSCLALGPGLALILILRADPSPINTLIAAPPIEPTVTGVTATFTGLTPNSGELRTRISIAPSTELVGPTGRLTQPISVLINGAQGADTTVYQTGETISPFEVSLPLTDGTTTRYPFDSYRGTLIMVLTVDSSETRESVPVVVDARSVVGDFVVSARPSPDMAAGPQPVTIIDWSARRPATTTIYAIWLMVLMWGLAVTGLLIVWAVVIWMVDIPFWSFGYFVGVLFALPPLRDSLPGRPPPGTIFDFVSFYWSVTIIGVGLILLLSIWLYRTRSEQQLQQLDSTRPE